MTHCGMLARAAMQARRRAGGRDQISRVVTWGQATSPPLTGDAKSASPAVEASSAGSSETSSPDPEPPDVRHSLESASLPRALSRLLAALATLCTVSARLGLLRLRLAISGPRGVESCRERANSEHPQ